MNKVITNVKVDVSGIKMTELIALRNLIFNCAGYNFGYTQHKFNDTYATVSKVKVVPPHLLVSSFTLTLCASKRVSKTSAGQIKGLVQGYLFGRDISLYKFEWI